MPPWKKMERMWGLASDGGGDDTGDFKIINALLLSEFGGRIQCTGGDGAERWRVWVRSSSVCDGSEPVLPVEGEDKGKIVGYKSGCLTVKSDKYCCRGEYAEPRNCKASIFGHLFQVICPMAYSYAYDAGLKMCKAP